MSTECFVADQTYSRKQLASIGGTAEGVRCRGSSAACVSLDTWVP